MMLRPRVKREDEPRPGRLAISKKDQDYLLNAIINWIPIEVIAVYKFVMGFIPAGYGGWQLWLTIIVLGLTPLWIAFATKPEGRKTAWRQVALSPCAFVCWVVAIQPDLVESVVSAWQGWMGSVVLGVGTLLLPILDGIMKRLGIPQN